MKTIARRARAKHRREREGWRMIYEPRNINETRGDDDNTILGADADHLINQMTFDRYQR